MIRGSVKKDITYLVYDIQDYVMAYELVLGYAHSRKFFTLSEPITPPYPALVVHDAVEEAVEYLGEMRSDYI